MRSVLVHLKNATEQQVAEFLTAHYTSYAGASWTQDVANDPCLYVEIYRDLVGEAEPQDIAALKSMLGASPSVSIIVDVSGRYPGDQQVREFVSALLSEFSGVAGDGYTEGFWTLDEILADRKRPAKNALAGRPDGHHFFDYRFPWKLRT